LDSKVISEGNTCNPNKQVTDCYLHIILKKSYVYYLESAEHRDQHQTIEEWCAKCKQEATQFNFWYTSFKLVVLVLAFI